MIDKVHLKEVMNLWGDSLFEYGLLIRIDATSKNPLKEARNQIKLAKYYFEMALDKYLRTESGDRILRFAIFIWMPMLLLSLSVSFFFLFFLFSIILISLTR